ncbi:hypothetical protein J7L18_02055, partial [Candidatus Bathyarchaeota archaeon]|nr:hypothetical protein [Candidatus Bathyarchaeota archaeon]
PGPLLGVGSLTHETALGEAPASPRPHPSRPPPSPGDGSAGGLADFPEDHPVQGSRRGGAHRPQRLSPQLIIPT